MKENFIKNSILTCFVFFVFASTIGAVDRKSNGQNVSGFSSSEQIKIDEQESASMPTKRLSFREKLKIVRQINKEMRVARKGKTDVPMIVLYILAVLLPPVAVGLYTNWGEPTLWNLLFTLLMWVPGIVHAFYILLR
jgi:uncharacterized membrane protein YqaE (UPF0057 family)